MSAVWSPGSRSAFHHQAANAHSMVPLSSLVYQSQATAPFYDADLQRLVASSQTRNRREGVTGLLIHDEGRFLQWLEGPSDGLGRVWQSIRNDSRHTAVTLLGTSTAQVRFFGGSPMALGKRSGHSGVGIARSNEVVLPADLIESVIESPLAASSVLAGLASRPADELLQQRRSLVDTDRMSLQAMIDSLIIPEILARHARPVLPPFDIEPRAAELARLLVAAEPKAAFALIDTLRADGRSITQLCAGLFEPAARALGDMWQSDDCSDFEVTLGLGHLQVALRRVSVDTSSADVPLLPTTMPRAVLVAPSPREPHLLGCVIASEMFWRAGWDVRCEFPDSDAALNQLVHDRWFDVLDLSLSSAFTREHRLPAMATSIRAAYAHSLNPALSVIVDGRVFHEQPQAGTAVGADASATSARDLVPTALFQMQRRKPEREGEQSDATSAP